MSDVVICCENLSKQYRIGARQEPYRTLRDSLADMAKAPLRALLRVGRDRSCSGVETIWALKDVSFEVKRGEVVGIIGRNGAGKSTLLSILSRITEPTEGVARLKGRVASLLEVGTGFHPELTGRENIYLNAAILGMRKAEVNRKFDEIVAFAEVEKFINTPVKHYSSGMYMRLAFAVAAHLDPEILVIDEVLAVGDIEFQKKCLGKMGAVARSGRTVLFVSHNMGAVAALCGRVLWLDAGKVQLLGKTETVVSSYQDRELSVKEPSADLGAAEHYGNGQARFVGITVEALDREGRVTPVFRTGDGLRIAMKMIAAERVMDANVAVILYDAMGYRLIDVNTALQNIFLTMEAGNTARVEFLLHDLLLRPGQYHVGLWMGKRDVCDMDGVSYAAKVAVEHRAEEVLHDQVFPGPYQCRFDVRMKAHGA